MKTDKDLQHDVLDELKWEPSVNAAHVGVAVNNGIVTLSGHVPSYGEKSAAERAAKRVYGVKAVADELNVELPGSLQCNDEGIAQDCLTALRLHYSVPSEKIKVVVDNSWVTLDGEVEWQYQKDAAMAAIRHLSGVMGVSNRIMVKPRVVLPGDVKKQIEAAFRRSAEIDARKVAVEAHDGRVILKGQVRSFAERDEAQQAAWAAPGVKAVENQITVSP